MASCGSQSPEGQGVENTTKTLDNSSEISFAQAQLVETSDAMEACTQDKHRALIYLLEKSQFYYCSSTLEWVAIDLKGPKGDKGEKGDTGATGSSGKSGSNGQNGSNSIASNEWEDPVSHERWFLGRYVAPSDVARDAALCPTGSSSPTDTEMDAAIGRGIFTKLSASFASYNIAIVRTELVSSGRWKLTYALSDTLRVTSNQITTADYSGSLPAFWTTRAYIMCIVD
jgi:Collagen triple helix repeat (20 copies).